MTVKDHDAILPFYEYPFDLTLQNGDLVAESENLCIAGIAGGEYPADSAKHEAGEGEMSDTRR